MTARTVQLFTRLAALIVLAAVPAWGARAADIPTTPQLRIETGMHGGAINAIAVDAADKQIVTVSDDKTARIWSATDGDLVTTLRGPIGPGPEGGLYAVALSPSGKTIAVGGYTGIAWDNSAAIYLFGRAEGNWIGRIALGAGADVITHLAFSPDGHYLAVATNDAHGLRVIDTRALTAKIVDADYADAIEWLDFAPDGRLVTSSLDGTVRLYDANFVRVKSFRVPDDRKPLSVAFAIDGSAVAVGLLDGSSVLVLGGRDLKQAAELKGAPERSGTLSIVAWSANGRTLYAGGTYGDPSGQKLLRTWPLTDLSKGTDVAVSDDTVTALIALDDGVAFASAEPGWGKLGGDGKISLGHHRVYADFRDGDRSFALSSDGSAVEFGFARGGKIKARFDVLAGTFDLDPKPRDGMKPPAASAGGASLSDWRNGDKPRLNDRMLPLDANERARSASAAGDMALLGTDYFLRAYKGGQPVWRAAVPAPVWVVNQSADGRLAVAGLGDGTIRWYRLADGVEILSLFAEPDGKHWVAWTPEGFFDHGDGGEQVIGYHLNQVDQGRPKGAAFVRVEQLYALFFRRDLVVKKFQGQSESEITDQLARVGDVRSVLGKGLPPDIRLTEYCLGTNCFPVAAEEQSRGVGKLQLRDASAPEVVLHFDVVDRGGGVGPIIVRDKGATVASSGQTRGIKDNVHSEERTVQLEPGTNIIMLSAFNGAKEIETGPKERPLLGLRFDKAATTKPVMRLLAVGIDSYTGKGIPALANAAADAKGVAEIMRGDPKHDVFGDVDAIVLADADATLANIDKAFEDLAARTKPDDLVFVFLAGHGIALDGRYFYIPVDVPDTQDESIRKHALTYDDLGARLGRFPTARAIVVLDTCYSGAFAIDDSIQRDSRDQTVGKQISHATGRFILAGSSSQQEALDGVNGHGVFTDVLLTGLKGDADTQAAGNHDGKVSIYELGEYAKLKVPELAAKIARGYSQKPRWFFNGDEMFDLRDVN
ncbi:MAG TPA: caspase family protein [Stellaceae bacterium]|nr:caspase family protein [Stellaceae bacterium]